VTTLDAPDGPASRRAAQPGPTWPWATQPSPASGVDPARLPRAPTTSLATYQAEARAQTRCHICCLRPYRAGLLAAAGIFAAHKFNGPDAAQRAAQDRDAARLAGQYYLEALATGDAHTALALSAGQPATPQLLTDQALGLQLSATPITHISVTNDLEEEAELLRRHLDTARYQLLIQYPDVDPALLLNCLLLAATEAFVAQDCISANYHLAWFHKLNQPPSSQ
jgi:hypothetical protein